MNIKKIITTGLNEEWKILVLFQFLTKLNKFLLLPKRKTNIILNITVNINNFIDMSELRDLRGPTLYVSFRIVKYCTRYNKGR